MLPRPRDVIDCALPRPRPRGGCVGVNVVVGDSGSSVNACMMVAMSDFFWLYDVVMFRKITHVMVGRRRPYVRFTYIL